MAVRLTLTLLALTLFTLPPPLHAAEDDAVTVAADHNHHDAAGHGDAVEVQPADMPATGQHATAGDSAHAGHGAGEDDGGHDAHGDHGAGHADILGLPHGRHASGTSWMPDSTPGYSWMSERGGWTRMFHGAAHLTWIDTGGPRGDSGIYSPNWAMLKASRPSGCRGEWELTAMLSLDPLTVGGAGYPLLFQTGETWNGQPLVDHQHPHNYFMDLSAKYKWLTSDDSALYLYLAPVGEPALGPPAFMHRSIAFDYPLSPIGHHWQDSTHIAYGVATLGVQSREWQLEASTFNGREPGEDRSAIEAPTFDSYSGRLSWNPGRNLALQVSRGELKDPEELHPGDVERTTASAIYNHDLGCNRNWQTAFVWGRNDLEGARTDSWLVESALKQDGGWSPFFRYEQVEKSAEELVLPDSFDHDEVFTVKQGTVGFTCDLNDEGPLLWGLGGAYSFNIGPAALDPVYGSNPDGWLLFLRVHPGRMSHDGGEHSGHDGAQDAGHGEDSHAAPEGAVAGEQADEVPAAGAAPEHEGHGMHEEDAGKVQAPEVPEDPHAGHQPQPESETGGETPPADPHHSH